mmetsp:Transcript_3578/g.5490  ORF Transcript_3578/g.5490 Transcript_3578/m.5490 type:complete len:346 (-) Transcript_3578:816-1853(-)
MLCNKLPSATCESSPALSKLPLDRDCNKPPKAACESFPAFSRLPLLDNDWINVSICAELFDSVSKEAKFDDDASSTRFSTDCKSMDMRTLKLPRSADCDNFFPSTFASSEPSPFTISSTNLAAEAVLANCSKADSVREIPSFEVVRASCSRVVVLTTSGFLTTSSEAFVAAAAAAAAAANFAFLSAAAFALASNLLANFPDGLYFVGGFNQGGVGGASISKSSTPLAAPPTFIRLGGSGPRTPLGPIAAETPGALTRFVWATRSKNRLSSSLSSILVCCICSVVMRLISATLLRKTCFPIQLFPTNFLDIRIGSQFNSLERKFRNVVPSVNGSKPLLNSPMRRLA